MPASALPVSTIDDDDESGDSNEVGAAAIQSAAHASFSLNQFELEARRSLLPPQADHRPIAYRSIMRRFKDILRQFKIWRRPLLDREWRSNVQRVGEKMFQSCRLSHGHCSPQIIAYNARVLGWYPTSSSETLWIRDDQIALMTAGLWNALAQFNGNVHNRLGAVPLLGYHLMTQILVVCGARAISWLDNVRRPVGEVGRFLRWHHVKIRLCGYDRFNEPKFVVFGSLSASKHASRLGDSLWHRFTFGSKDRDKAPLSTDVAMSFILLAITQGAMGPDLERCVKDKSFGQTLLDKAGFHSGANGLLTSNGHVFSATKSAEDCPVFVVVTRLSATVKHASDKAALEHDTPQFSRYSPLRSNRLSDTLAVIGASVGLLQPVTTAVFRRTFAMRALADGNQAGWQIADQMGHTKGDKRLHRLTYRSTYAPFDYASVRSGMQDTTCEDVSSAIASIGSITTRIDSSAVAEEELASVRSLLKSIAEVQMELTEDERVPLADQESVVMMHASLAGGVRVSFSEAMRALMDVAAEDEHWIDIAAQPHPYDTICEGSVVKVLDWLRSGGPWACPSCHGKVHSSSTNRNSVFEAYNSCLKKEHDSFSCFVCNRVFPMEESKDHVEACLEQRISSQALKGLTFENLVSINGSGRRRMEGATYFVCPSKACAIPRLRLRHFHEDEAHLRTLVPAPTLNSKKLPFLGNGAITTFIKRGTLIDHIVKHFFVLDSVGRKDDTGKRDITSNYRLAIRNEQIECAIVHCTELFANTPIGISAYIAHAVNDHKLPLLQLGDGTLIESIEAADLVNMPAPLPFIGLEQSKVPAHVAYVKSDTRPTEMFTCSQLKTAQVLVNRKTDARRCEPGLSNEKKRKYNEAIYAKLRGERLAAKTGGAALPPNDEPSHADCADDTSMEIHGAPLFLGDSDTEQDDELANASTSNTMTTPSALIDPALLRNF